MDADKGYAESDVWSKLMARAQDGDRQAYRRLLGDIAPWLRRIAWRALRDANEAEDAVQDILLTIHTSRHSYDPARPIKPWLLALTRARIIDRQRVLVRRAGRERSLDTEIEHHGETFAAIATNMDAGMDGRALHRALAALPVGQRQAIGLLKLQEMSLHEASAVSGQSIGALKVAVHRGMARLRALLGDPA